MLILVAVGSLVAVAVLAILIDAAIHHNKVHSGLSVAGIEVGGQTETKAVTTIQAVVDKSQNSPITLKSGGRTWTLMPSAVGAKMDIEGAVQAAMNETRERTFFADVGTRWKLYFSHENLPLSGSVDGEKLRAFVAGIARELDVQPVNASLAIDNGKISVVESAEGQVVNQTRLVQQLGDLLVSLHRTTVQVPVTVKEPAVTADDNRAAQEQAETMISEPIMVTYEDKSWTLTTDEIASSMSFKAEMKNGISTLVPFMDSGNLQPLLEQIAPDVQEKPVDASFAHNDTRVWVVASRPGKELDAEATAAAITAATLKPSNRAVKVVIKDTEPDFTTEEARAWGIEEQLSSYSTTYVCDARRQVNVKAATKYATNVFLAPGQEYNFDKQIGPRKPERGFRLAPGIVGPGKLEDVYGGGICQVSTTMFNAVADKRAGLDIVERHNHSLFIKHYPLGRDATVTAGGPNLRFVNDTDHYVWITGESTGVKTTIIVWGTDQGRSTKWTIGDAYDVVPMAMTTITDSTMKAGTTKVLTSGQEGWRLKTTRVVTENGKVIHKDVWTNYWPMYSQEVKIGTATTKPSTTTTTESPTTTEPPTSSATTTSAP
jgi:vancomycin resistance protein YoaR